MKNHNKKGNKKAIIDYYLNAEDKAEAIDFLSKKYEITKRRIYQILEENEIPPPKKYALKMKFVKEEDIYDIDRTLEIIGKLETLRKKDKGLLHRLAHFIKYFEDLTGLDAFERIIYNLLRDIAISESEQLEFDLESIRKGDFDILSSTNSTQRELESIMAEAVKKIIQDTFDINKSETTIKPESESKKFEQPLFSKQAMEMFMLINTPKIYYLYKVFEKQQKEFGKKQNREKVFENPLRRMLKENKEKENKQKKALEIVKKVLKKVKYEG